MAKPNQYKAQDFIDAIKNSGGIISTIAARVGCNWNTAKKYITEYATVQKAYQDECEKMLDMAESTVLGAIRDDKDVPTAKWYLTMKGGRERGYVPVQRQEHTGKDGEPLVITLKWNE